MKHHYWAVVPAAGIGSRFSSTQPKQYTDLLGVSILERTLVNLLDSHLFSGIVVALAENDTRFSTLSIANDSRIKTVMGGQTRAESVYHGLKSLVGLINSDDWVMVHDAARPLLEHKYLLRLQDQLEQLSPQKQGAILALPVTDTLKKQHADQCDDQLSSIDKIEKSLAMVQSTVSRENLWSAQTPQAFSYQVLMNTLDDLYQADRLAEMTDEASAMEFAGVEIALVEGSLSNIKITRPEDLQLAQAFMMMKQEATHE